jgi:hypothetical protein
LDKGKSALKKVLGADFLVSAHKSEKGDKLRPKKVTIARFFSLYNKISG